MRRSAVLSVVLLASLSITLAGAAVAEEPQKRLTLEAIADGSLTAPEPSQVRWVDDGRIAYFLSAESDADEDGDDGEDDGNGGGRDLWVMDAVTGEKEVLVPAEVLREIAPSASQAGVSPRERTNRSRFRVPDYRFSPDGGSILFPGSGRLVLYRLEDGETTVLAPEKRGVRDPKFTPDGAQVVFVHEHDLWIVPAAGGEARRLTRGGNELLLHGGVDWVYAEEFGVRSGYHVSPDGRHVAFLEMDLDSVPTYPITDQLSWQATVDLQRYPRPGDPNPKVRVGIVDVESGRTAWLDRAAEYVPRVDWAGPGRLAVQLMNRGQDELELVLADPAGRSRTVLTERDDHWVDVTDDLTFLEGGERFLWTSARSGLRHVYLYGADGALIRQLTRGDFRVGEVAGVDEGPRVDEEGGFVYYTANADNLLGADLYRVKLEGSEPERLTREKGTHQISMNPAATAWIDQFSTLDVSRVRRRTVHDPGSGHVAELWRDLDLTEYGLVQPQLTELRAPDGALVRLQLMTPPELEQGKKVPVVVYVYGMAGFPTIRDGLRGNVRRTLFHHFLVQQGYVVAYVDDRSSSIPGHKHAVSADGDVGPVAAADARVAVEHLRSLPYVDGERIGIWGWSGGGFSAAFQLGHTDLYKVGVAGAPVTDWRLYDSIYTERYMGLPRDDPEAYDRTSALLGAPDMNGRLLLIHGTHDDNVHPQNTLKMVDALIKARKPFEVMLYPNQTHGISGADHNLHLYRLIFEFFERHL